MEVDLVAQTLTELIERLDRIVIAAAKAAVDEPLDASFRASAQRRNRKGRTRDGRSDSGVTESVIRWRTRTNPQ